MQLTFVTPSTIEEMNKYRKEIEFLQKFLPFPHWSQTELDEFLESSLGELTLVYLDTLLIGSFTLELSRRSAELHGITRPDLKQLLCPRTARQVLHAVYTLFFNRVFIDLKKQVVVGKVPPEAKGALGFVRMWGFKKLPNKDRGDTVWVLDRETYLEKINVKKEGTQDESRDSAVSL